MNALKLVSQGAALAFIGYGVSKILSYGFMLTVARLGTAEYGQLSLAWAIFSIITIVSILGLNTGVSRYIAFYAAKKQPEHIKGTFYGALKVSFLLSVTLSILVYFSSEWLAINIFHSPSLALYLKILAFAIPFASMGDITIAGLRSYTQSISYDVGLKNIGFNALKLFFALILILLGYKVLGAIGAIAISHVLIFCTGLFFWLRTTNLNLYHSLETKSELLKYSIPLFLTELITQVIMWTDVLMLGYYRTASEVGIYNASLSTSALIVVIPGSIVALLIPIMTRLYARQENKEFIITYQTSIRWIFFLTLPVFLYMVIFPHQLLTILFGSLYSTGGISLAILVIGYIIYGTCIPSRDILNVVNRPTLVMVNTMTAAIVNIILNSILIPSYGMIGGAIATSISLTIYALLGIIEVFILHEMKPFSVSFFKPIGAGVIAITVSWVVAYYLASSFFFYILNGIIFVLLYALILWSFKPLNTHDKEILYAIGQKIQNKH